MNQKSLDNLKLFSSENQPAYNPGRPKGTLNSSTILKRFLDTERDIVNPLTNETENLTVAEEMALQQIKSALKGDLNAYREILDRIEGKSIARTEVKASVTERPTLIFKKSNE